MLKISAVDLEKQKSFIPKKKMSKVKSAQYQNIQLLFTDPIFSDGFDVYMVTSL
jgi:hypothetical protein